MSLLANVPTLSYISWRNMLITYNETTYQIENSHTNKPYIYWNVNNPYLLTTSNIKLDEKAGLFYIIFNDKGTYTVVPNDDIKINFSENPSRDAITERIVGLSNETKDQFVAVEITIDGIKTTVAKCEEDIDKNRVAISTVDQKADEIRLEVQGVEKQYNLDKEAQELRDGFTDAMLGLQSVLGLFLSDMKVYMENNRLTSEEKDSINVYKTSLNENKEKLNIQLDAITEYLLKVGTLEESKIILLNSAKDELNTALNNLLTNIDTVCVDDIFTNTEIVAIVTYFGKVNTEINECKNLVDECIVLGMGGTLIEQVSNITLQQDAIKLEVKENYNSALSRFSELDVTLDGIESRVGTAEGNITTVTQTANKINWLVESGTSSSNMELTSDALNIIADGINLNGYVTFTNLSEKGKTTINGGNITSGTIRGIEIISSVNDNTNRVSMVGDGNYYYSPIKLAGKIAFDSNGEGTEESARDRFLIQSLNSYVLKLLSTGDMSITSYDAIYFEANKLQTNCNLELTGHTLGCGDIYCSNNITCTSITLTDKITTPNVSATTITATNKITTSSISATSITLTDKITTPNVSATTITATQFTVSNSNNIKIAKGTIYDPKNGLKDRDYVRLSNTFMLGETGVMYFINAENADWADIYAGTIYSKQTAITSDMNLKTDIKYVNIDPQTISEDSGLIAPNVNITTEDMHEFIETLPMVSYRMKDDVKNGIDDTYYGFLAQEVLYTKVGSELIKVGEITNDEGETNESYRYSENKFVSFIAGALQEEIKERKEEIENLNNTIISLVERIKDLEDKLNK